MAKVTVSKKAVALWRQVLAGPVSVPEWEVRKWDGDVKELVGAGLVKVTDGVWPQFVLTLVDPSMTLTVAQIELLTAIAAFEGDFHGTDLMDWAINKGYAGFAKTLYGLIDLGVIERVEKDGLLVYRLN